MISTYLADAYELYASSAQAAQSAVRNILASFFPLFAHKMVSSGLDNLAMNWTPIKLAHQYSNLGYAIAGSILGGVAAILAVVPFLLMRYGATVRKNSAASQSITSSGTNTPCSDDTFKQDV